MLLRNCLKVVFSSVELEKVTIWGCLITFFSLSITEISTGLVYLRFDLGYLTSGWLSLGATSLASSGTFTKGLTTLRWSKFFRFINSSSFISRA